MQNNHDSKKEKLLLERDEKQKRVKRLGKLILDCDEDADAAESCFQEELKLLTKQIKKLSKELQALEDLPKAFSPTLDPEELRKTLPMMLKKLSDHSREFSELLRKIFPTIHIRPIQAIDSTQIWPRAYVTFNPEALSPFHTEPGELEHFTIDVFTPSTQFQFREEAVALLKRFPELNYKQLGRMLGTSNATILRVMKLNRMMLELGLAEPYRVLDEAPLGAARWRDLPRRDEQTVHHTARPLRSRAGGAEHCLATTTKHQLTVNYSTPRSNEFYLR